jgi:outer membrane protein TolC
LALPLLIVQTLCAAAPELPRAMTLDQAVGFALEHHPRLFASVAAEKSAEARIDLARVERLPRGGVTAQLNRSTGNTAPGAFFATPGVPPIAGAPRGRTFDSGAWQTGLGAWASWDALALWRQAAAIDQALAGRAQAGAARELARLEVGYAAADAFVLLLEAQEAVHAAEATIARAKTVEAVVKTLVEQSLRPGADAARVDAELAAAHTQGARAAQAVAVRRQLLAEALGDASGSVEATGGALLSPLGFEPRSPVADAPAPAAPVHPRVAVEVAALARAEAARATVSAQYLPRVELVASLWARGSGYFGSAAEGLAPDIPNWAAGAVVSWDLLELPLVKARAAAADAEREGASSRRDEAALAVASQLAQASALLEGARVVAEQAEVALKSARAAEAQTLARFKTGLSSVVEVADAQRLLAQAELDEAVARLEVRRAQLLLARAGGDLAPFLAAARGG